MISSENRFPLFRIMLVAQPPERHRLRIDGTPPAGERLLG
jgi:hypothetical protein